jgi:hypothetical protein
MVFAVTAAALLPCLRGAIAPRSLLICLSAIALWCLRAAAVAEEAGGSGSSRREGAGGGSQAAHCFTLLVKHPPHEVWTPSAGGDGV